MDINSIHWHDSKIHRVIETPSKETVAFEVSYPIDWESNIFEPKTILFNGVHGYEIHEGSFYGSPTILAATVSAPNEHGVCNVTLETNAGFRVVRCKELSLST